MLSPWQIYLTSIASPLSNFFFGLTIFLIITLIFSITEELSKDNKLVLITAIIVCAFLGTVIPKTDNVYKMFEANKHNIYSQSKH